MRTVIFLMAVFGAVFALRAGEMIVDGGFEDDVVGMAGPAGERWGRFASVEPMGLRIVSDPLHPSNQVLRIEAREEPGAYQGVFQEVTVIPGKSYLVSVRALEDEAARPGPGSTSLLSVEWRDADGQEVGREDGPVWSGLGTKKWQPVEWEVEAPDGAARAHFVLLQRNPENASGAAGGAVLVDDFSVKQP